LAVVVVVLVDVSSFVVVLRCLLSLLFIQQRIRQTAEQYDSTRMPGSHSVSTDAPVPPPLTLTPLTVVSIRVMGQVKLEKLQKARLVEAVNAYRAHINLLEDKAPANNDDSKLRSELRELKKSVFVDAAGASANAHGSVPDDTQDYLDRSDIGFDAILKLSAEQKRTPVASATPVSTSIGEDDTVMVPPARKRVCKKLFRGVDCRGVDGCMDLDHPVLCTDTHADHDARKACKVANGLWHLRSPASGNGSGLPSFPVDKGKGKGNKRTATANAGNCNKKPTAGNRGKKTRGVQRSDNSLNKYLLLRVEVAELKVQRERSLRIAAGKTKSYATAAAPPPAWTHPPPTTARPAWAHPPPTAATQQHYPPLQASLPAMATAVGALPAAAASVSTADIKAALLAIHVLVAS
jgi:hypothetical protein